MRVPTPQLPCPFPQKEPRQAPVLTGLPSSMSKKRIVRMGAGVRGHLVAITTVQSYNHRTPRAFRKRLPASLQLEHTRAYNRRTETELEMGVAERGLLRSAFIIV
jgi:hypothetical protein